MSSSNLQWKWEIRRDLLDVLFILLFLDKQKETHSDDQHKYQTNTHMKSKPEKMENTIIHVCLTPGSSQDNAPGSNSLAKEEEDVKVASQWAQTVKKTLFLQSFTQTKSCRISTPCGNHSFESACGTEAPWLKTNTHHEWIYTFAFFLNVLSFKCSERGQANIRLCGLATHPH